MFSIKIEFEYVEDAFGAERLIHELFFADPHLGNSVESIIDDPNYIVIFKLFHLTDISTVLTALRNEDYHYETITCSSE